MSWQDESLTMLRVLLNDLDCDNQVYSDNRLEEILVVAARYVDQELNLSTDYVVSVSDRTITPDPTDSDTTNNRVFLNMMVLKAACLSDWSIFRTKALLAGVEAKCGPATISTLKHIDGFKELLTQGPCAAYEKLKKEQSFGRTDVIIAIMSPFVSNNFDPQNLSTYAGGGNNRGRESNLFS